MHPKVPEGRCATVGQCHPSQYPGAVRLPSAQPCPRGSVVHTPGGWRWRGWQGRLKNRPLPMEGVGRYPLCIAAHQPWYFVMRHAVRIGASAVR